jgi:hypothetical protein
MEYAENATQFGSVLDELCVDDRRIQSVWFESFTTASWRLLARDNSRHVVGGDGGCAPRAGELVSISKLVWGCIRRLKVEQE